MIGRRRDLRQPTRLRRRAERTKNGLRLGQLRRSARRSPADPEIAAARSRRRAPIVHRDVKPPERPDRQGGQHRSPLRDHACRSPRTALHTARTRHMLALTDYVSPARRSADVSSRVPISTRSRRAVRDADQPGLRQKAKPGRGHRCNVPRGDPDVRVPAAEVLDVAWRRRR